MNIGLIGLPNSGKTTIFNALARLQAEVSSYANSKSEPNKAVLKVADDRVATLSEMYQPKKTTYAVIELIDFAGLTQGAAREGLFSNSSMGLIKNTDAIALVVRHFRDDPAESPTPLRDLEKLGDELLISDLIIAEGRLERIQKACRRGKKTNLLDTEEKLLHRMRGKKTNLLDTEEKLLHRIIDHLSSNRPIRDLKLDGEPDGSCPRFHPGRMHLV
jgi:ribosome-binding ATPase YchF (GTP1/OBG family)